MPELPEVETTKRGIEPLIIGKYIKKITVFQPALRYVISPDISSHYIDYQVKSLHRRAKYLILNITQHNQADQIIFHLGMSGSLRIETQVSEKRKHDHIIFEFQDQNTQESIFLHFHDPRRFGFILDFPQTQIPPFLSRLAPEPLCDDFNGEYLYNALKHRKKAIKVAIMDQSLVVGVGNIYASEALFMSKIHPKMPCTHLRLKDATLLVSMIQQVLQASIEKGGTSLKDFVNPSGNPGYFAQTLKVYGKKGDACTVCQTPIIREVLGQRASYWCPYCQIETHNL